jgi:hypothetical protein
MARINFKAIPAGVSLSVEEVTRIAASAAELLKRFQARIDNLRAQVEARRAALDEEAAEIVRDSPPENRAAAKTFAKQTTASKFSKFLIGIRSNSYANRQELLKPLAALAEQATFLLGLFSSPAQALGRVALGEASRTQYQLQLTGAGPVELESAATLAIVTGNKPLAAAVVTVVDRMPAKDRPFSVNEFATIVWGEQHAEVVTKLKTAIHANKLALIADREFQTGEVNMVSKISALLDQRDIDAASIEPSDAA